jgi:uncharacterized protein YeaO (DUF488 family)
LQERAIVDDRSAPPAEKRSGMARRGPRQRGAAMIRVKRIYDPPAPEDGCRVLVDRLWPRGVRKADAAIDLWLREIAPSTELRHWFAHDPAKWAGFRERYRAELSDKEDALAGLRGKARESTVTLLYAAHDAEHNNAVALKGLLES